MADAVPLSLRSNGLAPQLLDCNILHHHWTYIEGVPNTS